MIFFPELIITKHPVPYVDFILPGEKHAWPTAAAGWSPSFDKIETLLQKAGNRTIGLSGPEEEKLRVFVELEMMKVGLY